MLKSFSYRGGDGWIWQDGSYLTVTFPSPVVLSQIELPCTDAAAFFRLIQP